MEALSGRVSSRSREPLSLELLKKLSQQACATAVQLFSFICVDQPPSEIVSTLIKFWNREGKSFFRSLVPEPDETFDISPDLVEIFPTEQPAQCQESERAQNLIHAVQDRAKLVEEILSSQSESPANLPAEAQETLEVPHVQEDSSMDECPLNLVQLLRQVLHTGGDVFDVGDVQGSGKAAMLRRVVHMMPYIRHFVRYARVQEGLLSPTVLNGTLEPLNTWNCHEAELAKARRAANVTQLRLSRAQSWWQAQQRLCSDIQRRNSSATEEDPGLREIKEYVPHTDDNAHQVIVFRHEAAIDIGLVLSIYRGAIVRKPGKQDTVRTSKPHPEPLEASCTKLVHVAVAVYAPDTDSYNVSCAHETFKADPVNNVFGELTVQDSRVSRTRFHFRLSGAATAALKLLRQDGKLPALQILEPNAHAKASPPTPVPPTQSADLEFNDRSFMRHLLAQNSTAFCKGLEKVYRERGFPFVQPDGKVLLNGGGRETWETLLTRVPGFFEVEFAKFQGYRFSQAVFHKLSHLMPKGFLVAMCIVCLNRFACQSVASRVCSGSFVMQMLPRRRVREEPDHVPDPRGSSHPAGRSIAKLLETHSAQSPIPRSKAPTPPQESLLFRVSAVLRASAF